MRGVFSCLFAVDVGGSRRVGVGVVAAAEAREGPFESPEILHRAGQRSELAEAAQHGVRAEPDAEPPAERVHAWVAQHLVRLALGELLRVPRALRAEPQRQGAGQAHGEGRRLALVHAHVPVGRGRGLHLLVPLRRREGRLGGLHRSLRQRTHGARPGPPRAKPIGGPARGLCRTHAKIARLGGGCLS